MILYNVTVNIDFDVEDSWKTWMKQDHIPKVITAGNFVSGRMYKLLNEVPEATGATYSIQYQCDSMEQLDIYLEKHAPALVQEHINLYGSKHVAFRSILEEV